MKKIICFSSALLLLLGSQVNGARLTIEKTFKEGDKDFGEVKIELDQEQDVNVINQIRSQPIGELPQRFLELHLPTGFHIFGLNALTPMLDGTRVMRGVATLTPAYEVGTILDITVGLAEGGHEMLPRMTPYALFLPILLPPPIIPQLQETPALAPESPLLQRPNTTQINPSAVLFGNEPLPTEQEYPETRQLPRKRLIFSFETS